MNSFFSCKCSNLTMTLWLNTHLYTQLSAFRLKQKTQVILFEFTPNGAVTGTAGHLAFFFPHQLWSLEADNFHKQHLQLVFCLWCNLCFNKIGSVLPLSHSTGCCRVGWCSFFFLVVFRVVEVSTTAMRTFFFTPSIQGSSLFAFILLIWLES